MDNIIMHLQEIRNSLPKKQQKLCDYICGNTLEASMQTIAGLAEKSGVGTATVTRMIYSLGYTSVQDFREDLRGEVLKQSESSYQSYMDMFRQFNQESNVRKDLEDGLRDLQTLNREDYISQIQKGARMIMAAEQVALIGLRTAAPVASFMELNLREIKDGIQSIGREPEYAYDKVLTLTGRDLLIAMIARPTVKKTVEIIRLCHSRGVPVLMLLEEADHDVLEDIVTLTIRIGIDKRLLTGTPIFLTAELLIREVNRLAGSHLEYHYRELDRLLKENNLTIWD